MLRISSPVEVDTMVTLKVEGVLAGDWVTLLETECVRHLDAQKSVELDFAGVRFVDRNGVAMTQALFTRGVRVVGATVLVSALLWRSDVP